MSQVKRYECPNKCYVHSIVDWTGRQCAAHLQPFSFKRDLDEYRCPSSKLRVDMVQPNMA